MTRRQPLRKLLFVYEKFVNKTCFKRKNANALNEMHNAQTKVCYGIKLVGSQRSWYRDSH